MDVTGDETLSGALPASAIDSGAGACAAAGLSGNGRPAFGGACSRGGGETTQESEKSKNAECKVLGSTFTSRGSKREETEGRGVRKF